MHSLDLTNILILMAIAVAVVAIFKKLNLSPVLGYLFAGILIGPQGFSFIKDSHEVAMIGEVGILFLLFSIGLELTFSRLKQMRTLLIGFGLSQLAITGGVIGGVAHFVFEQNVEASIILGLSLAISSSAIVIKIMQDKSLLTTQSGRVSISTLISQDLAVVPLLILIPLLAAGGSDKDLLTAILTAMAQAVGVVVLIIWLGRSLLRPLFSTIASLGSKDLFLATTLLVVLGLAYATEQAGLSLALGAFVGGLLVAETEYKLQVTTDILPLKGILMGLFFITIGMTINLDLLKNNAYQIVGLTIAIIVVKGAIVYGLARLFKLSNPCSIETATLLPQAGEFAFVTFALASQSGLISDEITKTLFVVVSLSMAITPMLADTGSLIARKMRRLRSDKYDSEKVENETYDLEDHIIIIGYGPIGASVAEMLNTIEHHNYVVIEANSRLVHKGRKANVPVFYGNTLNSDVLESVGAKRARMAIITTRDDELALKTVIKTRKNYPEIQILSRAKDNDSADQIKSGGANFVMTESVETSVRFGYHIMDFCGLGDDEVHQALENYKKSLIKDD